VGSVVVRLPTLAGTHQLRARVQDQILIRDLIVRLAQEESCNEIEPLYRQVLEGHHAGYIIAVNGRSVRSYQGLETPVHDGDIVSIFPLIAGGC
jgi:molybdopterin converting factor small subunit